jgi:hypothetical protein
MSLFIPCLEVLQTQFELLYQGEAYQHLWHTEIYAYKEGKNDYIYDG